MPPTLNRILWAGVPAAALLAGVGFALAEVADVFLAANQQPRAVEVIDGAAPVAGDQPAAAVAADVRRTLPPTMAAWGFGLVTAYELLRRLVKGPPKKPAGKQPPPAADVDILLDDLMRKAEADRAGPEVTTPSVRQ